MTYLCMSPTSIFWWKNRTQKVNKNLSKRKWHQNLFFGVHIQPKPSCTFVVTCQQPLPESPVYVKKQINETTRLDWGCDLALDSTIQPPENRPRGNLACEYMRGVRVLSFGFHQSVSEKLKQRKNLKFLRIGQGGVGELAASRSVITCTREIAIGIKTKMSLDWHQMFFYHIIRRSLQISLINLCSGWERHNHRQCSLHPYTYAWDQADSARFTLQKQHGQGGENLASC